MPDGLESTIEELIKRLINILRQEQMESEDEV